MPTRVRQSADHRLAQMPDVFSVEDLQKTQGLSPKAASVYLARWQAANRIARLGPRCGLWVNLPKTGGVGDVQRAEGIVRKHPQAILGGLAVLERAGWATGQSDRDLLVPQGGSKAQFDGTRIVPCTTRLHAALGALLSGQEPDTAWFLPVLTPSLAEAVRRHLGEAATPLDAFQEQAVGHALARLEEHLSLGRG